MIIGMVGFIGSGKDTAADYLVQTHGFERDSFATSLKDAVSIVFGWPRDMLEGLTPQARHWREQVDAWWSARLNIPNLTPRWILQHWGTDVLRNNFHDDIWIASFENRMRQSQRHVVISDVRFPNEIKAIRRLGGMCIWIQRGVLPEWYQCALRENTTPYDQQWILEDHSKLMPQKYPLVHQSEWAWIGQEFDAEVDNNGTMQHLYQQIKNLVLDRLDARVDLAA